MDDGENEIRTDISRWPLVVVTPPRVVTDAQMERYLTQFDQIQAARPEPHCLVLDLRICERISPTQRKMITDRMPDDGQVNPCQGLAMVFSSRILRGLLTAIFWVRKPPYPTVVFNELEPAIDWALRRLADGEAAASEPITGASTSMAGTWLVQGPAFRNVGTARTMAQRLQSAGLDALVVAENMGDLEFHVVRVSKLASRADAIAVRETIEANGYPASVLRGE